VTEVCTAEVGQCLRFLDSLPRAGRTVTAEAPAVARARGRPLYSSSWDLVPRRFLMDSSGCPFSCDGTPPGREPGLRAPATQFHSLEGPGSKLPSWRSSTAFWDWEAGPFGSPPQAKATAPHIKPTPSQTPACSAFTLATMIRRRAEPDRAGLKHKLGSQERSYNVQPDFPVA
jgi:hypothetical protein